MPRGKFENMLIASAKEIPVRYIEQKIAAKLIEAGIEFDKSLPKEIVDYFLSGATEPFHIPGAGDYQSLLLEITDADTAEIVAAVKEFNATLPDTVDKAARAVARSTLSQVKQNWLLGKADDDLDLQEFRLQIRRRWGGALDLSWLLIEMCREVGAQLVERYGRSRSQRDLCLREALSRILGRALQIGSEIITLLEAGYADGALARWRTLHELNMIVLLLTEHGDELAERYLAFEAIEAHDAMETFLNTHADLGFSAPSKRSVSTVRKAYDRAIKKYGKEFGRSNGWASHHLKLKKVGFPDIERAAGQAAMRYHYKTACFSIHGGPKSVSFRLGLTDPSVITTGANNSGLEEPGQNLAHTLSQLTIMVLWPYDGFELMVKAHVLSSLRDEISASFDATSCELRREDARIRRALKSHGPTQ